MYNCVSTVEKLPHYNINTLVHTAIYVPRKEGAGGGGDQKHLICKTTETITNHKHSQLQPFTDCIGIVQYEGLTGGVLYGCYTERSYNKLKFCPNYLTQQRGGTRQ